MKEKLLYRETQKSIWIKTLFFLITLASAIAYFYTEEARNLYLITSFLFLLVGIIFSNLTITISNKKIDIYFGLKTFRRSINISDIDFSSIKIEDAPLLYGIGLRFTPKGTLYNLAPGTALWLKSKKGKIIFVGTEKAEEIKKVLLNLG